MISKNMRILLVALVVLLGAPSAFSQDKGASIMEQVRSAAAKGDPESQYILGMSYLIGTRFPGDEKIGIKWLNRAAAQKFAKAEVELGIQYQEGRFVKKDMDQSIKWFQHAADQGDTTAQTNLAVIYLFGMGVDKNADKGLALLKKAVDQSDPNAEATLGYFYFYGIAGIKHDPDQAVKWATLAANQGSYYGQTILGIAYLYGSGIEQNTNKGIGYLRSAADKGFPLAIETLQKLQNQQRHSDALLLKRLHKESQERPFSSYPQVMSDVAGTGADMASSHILSHTNISNQNMLNTAAPDMYRSGAINARPVGESATLQGEVGTGGGYLSCHYITGSGYTFTTTGKNCPSPITVDPQSGRAW